MLVIIERQMESMLGQKHNLNCLLYNSYIAQMYPIQISFLEVSLSLRYYHYIMLMRFRLRQSLVMTVMICQISKPISYHFIRLPISGK